MERQDFSLNVFFKPTELSPYIKPHGRYTYKDLNKIFDETDVLIAPSIWYETFGYTVLEALSYGVPVIVSGNVGAKDIIPNGGGIVIKDITAAKLMNEIAGLSKGKLETMNRCLVEKANITTLSEMTSEIVEECY